MRVIGQGKIKRHNFLKTSLEVRASRRWAFSVWGKIIFYERFSWIMKRFLLIGLATLAIGFIGGGCSDESSSSSDGISAPTNLRARALSSTSVKLTWVL